jgi:hypothetical protein
MFDFSLLEELLAEAGFRHVTRVGPSESPYFPQEYLLLERDLGQAKSSLHVEAYKI